DIKRLLLSPGNTSISPENIAGQSLSVGFRPFPQTTPFWRVCRAIDGRQPSGEGNQPGERRKGAGSPVATRRGARQAKGAGSMRSTT
ncbi:hypothetical protein C1Y90_24235, partial [Salmonella enterica subsp. enterica serovar Typhimurium]|nr:hypothetical protein [Salmonella enterica subsp. enterica serovar Typhimurium]EEO0424199.1 hypothetical protein [Salmonella enterica subsp. enterica serovar Typhimurium]